MLLFLGLFHSMQFHLPQLKNLKTMAESEEVCFFQEMILMVTLPYFLLLALNIVLKLLHCSIK